jgi:hypothetical protein
MKPNTHPCGRPGGTKTNVLYHRETAGYNPTGNQKNGLSVGISALSRKVKQNPGFNYKKTLRAVEQDTR